MRSQHGFVIKLLLFGVRRKVANLRRLNLQCLAVNGEEYTIRNVNLLNVFAFDGECEVKFVIVPNEEHAVICFDQRPNVCLLKRAAVKQAVSWRGLDWPYCEKRRSQGRHRAPIDWFCSENSDGKHAE